jgi:ribosomal-protein-alanine N-acetyltransferase
MKIIRTKEFILRPITIKDAQGYLECHEDREAQKGFMSVPKNLDEARREIREKISAINKKKPTGESFAIEVNGEFAGWIELNHLNKKYHEHYGNIGYCINKKFRGKGITTKAVKLIVKYAFKKYKLRRLEGTCRTFNKASARVLEKAGFKLEGILRKNKFKDGRYLDDMIWARIRN